MVVPPGTGLGPCEVTAWIGEGGMQTPSHEKGRTFAGFDGLRLLGAVSVMFSHAFLIATGSEDTEPLVRLLGPGNIFGLYGVFVFFIISGFLLARSLEASRDAITYAVNRALRILPAFLLCTFIVAFVIGPLFSNLPVTEYFSSPETSMFVKTSLNSLDDASLPGVYRGPSGAVSTVVNGSLWSLHYEALSYVLLLLLWMLAPSSGTVACIAVTLSLLTWVFPSVETAIVSVAYTLPYFSGGVLMHWVHRRYGTTLRGALVSVVLLVIAGILGVQLYAFALFGAYLIVFLGDRSNPGSVIARKIGDCSYGLYLYGWPAEQIVRQLTHTTDAWRLFLMAVPLALALALLSCHAIERPAMRMRTATAARLHYVISRVFDGVRGARAGVVGAKIGFIAGASLILLSDVQWWYFSASMGELLLGVIGGSVIVMTLSRAAAATQTKFGAIVGGGDV